MSFGRRFPPQSLLHVRVFGGPPALVSRGWVWRPAGCAQPSGSIWSPPAGTLTLSGGGAGSIPEIAQAFSPCLDIILETRGRVLSLDCPQTSMISL